MRLTSHLSLSLIFSVASVSLAFAFYQTRSESLNMRRDVQQQALILGESLARTAEPLVADGASSQLQQLVDRFRDRATVEGIAAYDDSGAALAGTAGLVALLGRA